MEVKRERKENTMQEESSLMQSLGGIVTSLSADQVVSGSIPSFSIKYLCSGTLLHVMYGLGVPVSQRTLYMFCPMLSSVEAPAFYFPKVSK